MKVENEELEGLRTRVSKVEEGVFYFKEVAVQSIPQIDVMFDELERLRGKLDRWYLIVDLRETKQPGADIREHLRQKYLHMENPSHVVLVVGNNAIIRLAARFVAGRTLKMPYTVVKTVEQGLKCIKDAKV